MVDPSPAPRSPRSFLPRRAALWLTLLLCGVPQWALYAGVGYFLWAHALRGQPEPVVRELFAGVTYERGVRQQPRDLVFHLARVQLGTPGLGFLVTPAEPLAGRKLRAATVTQFARRHKLQLAINGDFFDPFHSNGPWDYYPHSGDPVDVIGEACSGGRCYARPARGHPTLYVACSGAVAFTRPPDVCHAISGLPLVTRGQLTFSRAARGPHPRTAVGLTKAGDELLLLIVDGRQPGYSDGLSLDETGELIASLGAWEAIALDGGGSSVLVAELDGEHEALSVPVHTRVIGWERPVANHLGLWAAPLPSTP